jgi:ATP-dependent Clp protease ATP-binding subunit ClpC
MGARLCEACGIRPATVEVEAVEDGQRRILRLCEADYARLHRQRWFSPWESLLAGLFPEGAFGERWADREAVDIHPLRPRPGPPPEGSPQGGGVREA